MIGQHYSVVVADPDKMLPGHLVYPGNDSDEVIGFIYCVHENVAEIVLFEPVNLDGIEYVKLFEMDQSALIMLESALSRTHPDVVDMWRSFID